HGTAHAHGHGGHAEAACLVPERAAPLGRDERIPVMLEQPTRLGDDPQLLTAEAERGVRVHDEPGQVLPATAAATPAAAPAAGARRLRALDLNGPAVDRRAVELADRLLGVFRRRHLDETEAARATGVAVRHHRGRLDVAGRGEDFAQTLIGGGEGQPADEKLDGHGTRSFGRVTLNRSDSDTPEYTLPTKWVRSSNSWKNFPMRASSSRCSSLASACRCQRKSPCSPPACSLTSRSCAGGWPCRCACSACSPATSSSTGPGATGASASWPGAWCAAC